MAVKGADSGRSSSSQSARPEVMIAAQLLGLVVMDRGEVRTRVMVAALADPAAARKDPMRHVHGPRWPLFWRRGGRCRPTRVIFIYRIPIIVCSVHRIRIRCPGREP
jgi:hypothetical protein